MIKVTNVCIAECVLGFNFGVRRLAQKIKIWYIEGMYTLMLLLIARTKFSDFSDQNHYC